MNRGDGSRVEEPDTEVLAFDAPELACLPKGLPADAGPGIAKTLRQLVRAAVSARPAVPVEGLAGQLPEAGQAGWYVNAYPVHRENIETEKNIEIPVTILRPGSEPYPSGGVAGTLLAIDDKETLISDPIVQEALQRDWLVVELDPRGFGEVAAGKPGWVFATSLLLGENFVWQQAWDLHFLLNSFQRSGSHRVALYGRGPNASLAATYAIWIHRSDFNLSWAILRGGFTSFQQFLDFPAALKPANKGLAIPFEYFAFAALRSLDIPQLLSGAACKTFLIDAVVTQLAYGAQSDSVRSTSIEQFIRSGW
jgi:hypothetical protein